MNMNMNINIHIDNAILQNIGDLREENLEIISRRICDTIKADYDIIFKRVNSIFKYRQILAELRKLPFVKQRSIEWLEMRKNRLTASDLYDAIKGGNTTLTLAKKKANVIIDNTNYNGIRALKWGTMFEPMATRCYSQLHGNIHVYDFGLICDPNNEHFGASPDGINELGIMVEIKCPISRKIVDGEIPIKYQKQIQGQLAVCGLEECDYIECEFKTFEDEDEYLKNITNDCTINHGVIAEYMNSDRQYYYLYSNPYKTALEALEDVKQQQTQEQVQAQARTQNVPQDEFIKYTYWQLVQINVQKVFFDHNGWAHTVPLINAFWKTVEECRLLPRENNTKKIKFIDDSD